MEAKGAGEGRGTEVVEEYRAPGGMVKMASEHSGIARRDSEKGVYKVSWIKFL
jgi:hypothetical protein